MMSPPCLREDAPGAGAGSAEFVSNQSQSGLQSKHPATPLSSAAPITAPRVGLLLSVLGSVGQCSISLLAVLEPR